jgi:hypothetical protein
MNSCYLRISRSRIEEFQVTICCGFISDLNFHRWTFLFNINPYQPKFFIWPPCLLMWIYFRKYCIISVIGMWSGFYSHEHKRRIFCGIVGTKFPYYTPGLYNTPVALCPLSNFRPFHSLWANSLLAHQMFLRMSILDPISIESYMAEDDI